MAGHGSNLGLKPIGSRVDKSNPREYHPCPCTPNERNGPMKPDRPDDLKGYKPFSDR